MVILPRLQKPDLNPLFPKSGPQPCNPSAWDVLELHIPGASYLTYRVWNSGGGAQKTVLLQAPQLIQIYVGLRLNFLFLSTFHRLPTILTYMRLTFRCLNTTAWLWTLTVPLRLLFQRLHVLLYFVPLFNSHATSHQQHLAMEVALPTFLKFSSPLGSIKDIPTFPTSY